MTSWCLLFAVLVISLLAQPGLTADDSKVAPPPAKSENRTTRAEKPPANLASSPTPSLAPSISAGSREHPQVVRTAMPHLVFRNDKDIVVERSEKDIPAAIVVGFGDDLAIAWDTRECRWLYAWRGGFIEQSEAGSEDSSGPETTTDIVGELIYLSHGPAPLSVTMGAAGGPHYFGLRMVEGVPEFLYMVGNLKVSERIFPSEDGASIVQKFSVERHPSDLILAAPLSANQVSQNDDGRGAGENNGIAVTNGTLKGDHIYVDSKQADNFTLNHSIGTALPSPTAPKRGPVARPVAIPLFTQADPEAAGPDTMSAPQTRPQPDKIKPPATQDKHQPGSAPKTEPDSPLLLSSKVGEPGPSPTEKPAPVITKARRYDRDILLTDPHIETASLEPESTAFADRGFKFTQLPDEVVGADHVRTFDRDKYIPGDILSYELDLDSDATVWLMFDKRVKELPQWLGKKFTKTGKIAVLDSGETFQILRADIDAGKLRLGPQDSGAGAHFYLIAASPRVADKSKQDRNQSNTE